MNIKHLIEKIERLEKENMELKTEMAIKVIEIANLKYAISVIYPSGKVSDISPNFTIHTNVTGDF